MCVNLLHKIKFQFKNTGSIMEAQDTNELMEQKSHGDKNQNRSALTISILAMVLAIASLGGSNAMKEATQ